MIVFEKLQQAKERIKQLVVWKIIIFKDYQKMVAIDLSKQKALDVDPKVIQQINFTENLNWREGATIFFIIEEAKGTFLDFSQETVTVV